MITVVSLLQLAGCQTTRGLAEVPSTADLGIPKDIFIYVLPPDNSRATAKWTNTLAEFVPKDHILSSPRKVDVPGAHVVTLRITERTPMLYNVPLLFSAVTLFIIPGCAINLDEADFEVAKSMAASYEPVNLHYSYSEAECIWLPLAFQSRDSTSSSPRRLYRQFFMDYGKQLKTAVAKGGEYE